MKYGLQNKKKLRHLLSSKTGLLVFVIAHYFILDEQPQYAEFYSSLIATTKQPKNTPTFTMTICEQTLSSYCFYVSALLIIHLTLSLRARCGLLTRRPTPSPQTINCVLGREQCKGFVSFFGDCRVFRSPPTNQVFPREFDENRSDMLSPNDVQLHMDTLEIYSVRDSDDNISLQANLVGL